MKRSLKFDPLNEIKCFDDLKKFEPFEDEWLRGGPVRRWVPKAYADKPIYVFETGGTTGIPKSRDRASKIFASTIRCSARRCPTSIFRRARTG